MIMHLNEQLEKLAEVTAKPEDEEGKSGPC
jgi:hypothetical protein